MRRHQLTPRIHSIEVVDQCISRWENTLCVLKNMSTKDISATEKTKHGDQIKSCAALLNFWKGYKQKHYSETAA